MAGLLKQLFTKVNQISRFNVQSGNKISLFPPLVSSISRQYSNAPTPYEIVDEKAEKNLTQEVISKVNTQVANLKQGRLFAVVHVAGKQFKITEGDIIIIQGYWPPEAGDKLTLDKVLLCGAADFTLIGKPLIQKGLVRVEATVIEKCLSHTKTHFKKKRRKQYMRINFQRQQHTMLRINTLQIVGQVNNPPEVRGLETAIF